MVTAALLMLVVARVGFARVGLAQDSYDRLGASCLGIALAVLPWVGTHVLLVPMLSFFALRSEPSAACAAVNGRADGIGWVVPFLGFLLGTVLGELVRATVLHDSVSSGDAIGVLTGLRIDGVMRVVDMDN